MIAEDMPAVRGQEHRLLLAAYESIEAEAAVACHCRCASTMRGPFPSCTTSQSRENAGVGRPLARCIVRAMLSRIDSDPIPIVSWEAWDGESDSGRGEDVRRAGFLPASLRAV
jgi:hypothetical protein